MKRTVPTIGFLILTAVVLSVFGYGTYIAWTLQPVGGIVMTIILAGLAYKVASEAGKLSKTEGGDLFSQKNIMSFVAVVAAVFVTNYLNHTIGTGAVVASGLVQILAALFLPQYAVPLATGSFAGMASGALLCDPTHVGFAALIAGVVYVLTTSVYGGFGGKLGTIGVTGCISAGVLLSGDFTNPSVPGWDVGWSIVVVSIVAAVVTYYINHNLKHGAVMASGIVGLVVGLVLPVLVPDIGGTLAVVAIMASFVGMSSQKHFPSALPIAVAGLFIALVFIYSAPFLGGAGGKLGSMAFGSGLAVRGFMDLLGGRKQA